MNNFTSAVFCNINAAEVWLHAAVRCGPKEVEWERAGKWPACRDAHLVNVTFAAHGSKHVQWTALSTQLLAYSSNHLSIILKMMCNVWSYEHTHPSRGLSLGFLVWYHDFMVERSLDHNKHASSTHTKFHGDPTFHFQRALSWFSLSFWKPYLESLVPWNVTVSLLVATHTLFSWTNH